MEIRKRLEKEAEKIDEKAAEIVYSNRKAPMVLTLILFVLALVIAACVAHNKAAPWPVVAIYWLTVATKYAFDYAKLEDEDD